MAPRQVTLLDGVLGAKIDSLDIIAGGVASGGGAVASVFGRVGSVVAASGDYAASKITNDSTVGGATVANALNTLASSGGVNSVFGRSGAVVATSGDYSAAKVSNDSTVSGATVANALDTLQTNCIQVIQWGSQALGGSTTPRWHWLGYQNTAANSTNGVGRFLAPRSGTLQSLRFQLTAGVATTSAVTATLQIDLVDTALTCTLPAGSFSASVIAAVPIAAGNIMVMKTVSVGSESSITVPLFSVTINWT